MAGKRTQMRLGPFPSLRIIVLDSVAAADGSTDAAPAAPATTTGPSARSGLAVAAAEDAEEVDDGGEEDASPGSPRETESVAAK